MSSRLDVKPKPMTLSRLNFSTAFSTNAVSIFNALGLKKVTRVEASTRYLIRFEDTPTTPEILQEIEENVSEWLYVEADTD
jgi:phosphoribosylformylglycinamidine synthase